MKRAFHHHITRQGVAGGGGGGGAPSNPDAVLLSVLNEEFTTPDDAPITVARSAEPGPGTHTTAQPQNLAVANSRLEPVTLTNNNWNYAYLSSEVGTAISRAKGYALYCKVRLTTLGSMFQLVLHTLNSNPLDPTEAAVDASILINSDGKFAAPRSGQTPRQIIDHDVSKTYELALVCMTAGTIGLIREYGTTQWKFLWYYDLAVAATMYTLAAFYNPVAGDWVTNIKTIDAVASGVDEFDTDFGWCPNLSKFAGASALSAYTPDIGPVWTGGGIAQFSVNGELECASQIGFEPGHVVVCESGISDCMIYVDNKDKLDGMGIVFRYFDDNNFLYARNLNNTHIEIGKVEEGGNSQIGSLAVTWYDDQRIVVKCEGTSIKAWAWRGDPLEVTSSFNQTMTKHGIIAGLSTACTFDNYSVWPLDMTFVEVE